MGFVKTFEEIMAARRPTADFYDAEMLTVFWETKPEIVARLLPPPLKPAAAPLAMAFVANYPKTNFDVTYHEGALFISAVYEGQEGNYCLAMPVTNDMAMAGGREYFGYPKKMAQIEMRREGDQARGWVERRGCRFVEIRATLNGRFNEPEAQQVQPLQIDETGAIHGFAYTYRFFPKPDGGPLDYNPWLMRQETLLRPKQIQLGEAEVIFQPSAYDPWAEVEVVKMLGAIYMIGDNSMLGGQALSAVDPMRFAPYAFSRTDMK
jgi:acetoacetate decarboxylase